MIVLDTGGPYSALDSNEALHGRSVVVLANRHRTLDLLCTDERHFRALKGSSGKPFRLLPFDA